MSAPAFEDLSVLCEVAPKAVKDISVVFEEATALKEASQVGANGPNLQDVLLRSPVLQHPLSLKS